MLNSLPHCLLGTGARSVYTSMLRDRWRQIKKPSGSVRKCPEVSEGVRMRSVRRFGCEARPRALAELGGQYGLSDDTSFGQVA